MCSPEILKFFAKYIERELGIVFGEHNLFQLQSRLEEIAQLLGKENADQLYAQAKNGIDGSFRQLLLDLATNNETSFFRDPKVFKAIEGIVLNESSTFLAPFEKLRIWSAACSTGQEALSTAIMIREYCEKNKTNISASILATDISDRVLEKATKGVYTQLEVQRGLPTSYLIKYFYKLEDDTWAASPGIKQLVEFKKVNLKSALSFPEKFHLILCRNVLLYQTVEAKIEILRKIATCLIPGGYLVLGSGESLFGLSSEFEQDFSKEAIVYRKIPK